MPIKLAANLSLLFAPDTPWPERCTRAAAQGFRFAEILFPYDQPTSLYRQWLTEAGLQTVLINTPVDRHFGLAAIKGAEAQFRKDFDRALAVSNELGAKAIHVMAGKQLPGAVFSTETLLSNLEYAVKLAEQTGQILMLETLNRLDVPAYFYHHPQQVAEVLDALPSPHLRQQFDFYHTLREGLDLIEELNRSSDRIGHVQIAQPPSRNEPDLLNGPMLAALRELERSGYQGWLGCEYLPEHSLEAGLSWIAPLERAGLVVPLTPS